MSSAPLISVVMANYNGAPYLKGAIGSLQAQSFPSWELIFVDDASRDDSVALAEELARRDARIVVVAQNKNLGPAAARNRALKLARGCWIAIFDSDDLMKPERLERLLRRAQADNAHIVADNLALFSAASPRLKTYFPEGPARWVDLAAFIDSSRLYAGCADLGYLKPMINRDYLKSCGASYDESLRIGEDFNLLARLLAHGAKLRLDPSPYYLYRRHPQSTSYRIRAEEISALIAAGDRMRTEFPCLSAEELRALARRRRSLVSLLLYDQAIMLLRGRCFRRAAALCASQPRIWPLLTRPLRARIRRLAVSAH